MPLPPASGLKDNWKNKAKLNNQHPQDEADADEAVLGGLTDEHASSVRPKFKKRKPGMVTEVCICVC
jgi:hypothetical protein